MSMRVSKNASPHLLKSDSGQDEPSCIWLAIGSIFQWGAAPQELTYQRKVQIISLMFDASLKERLCLLADLGWSIDEVEEIAIHPQGQSYSFDELEKSLNHKLSQILATTCLFAEAIGYQYKKSERVFIKGDDIVSIEILGSWAKNRQLWGCGDTL